MPIKYLPNLVFVTEHKIWVMWYIVRICIALLRRGILHDLSKYYLDEAESYNRWIAATAGLTYGTPEYKAVRKTFEADDRLHYSRNRHHPGYYENGISDMTPLDIIEMVCDWMAASKRVGGRDIVTSITLNKSNFGYDDKLEQKLIADVTETKKSITSRGNIMVRRILGTILILAALAIILGGLYSISGMLYVVYGIASIAVISFLTIGIMLIIGND